MTITTASFSRLPRTDNRVPRLLLWLIVLMPILIAGCSIGDKIDKLTDKVSDVAGDTVATLDNAIDALDRNSASWQSVLQDTTTKLTDEAQSTIRNEVSDLLNRSYGKRIALQYGFYRFARASGFGANSGATASSIDTTG